MVTVPRTILEGPTKVSTPRPWRRLGPFAVGGIWAIGFGSGSDLLLVLSANGRGVFDCVSGGRVARDSGDDTYDDDSETASGLGPLAGSTVDVAGKGGGIVTRWTLPLTSEDGWMVAHTRLPTGANEGVFLRAPTECNDDSGWARIAEAEGVRAIGFSPTGRTLVVAEPHTLHVWSR